MIDQGFITENICTILTDSYGTDKGLRIQFYEKYGFDLGYEKYQSFNPADGEYFYVSL
jgi:hypothetical protein